MSLKPVGIITRREVSDLLGDWRIVLPISLLAFVLPFIVAGGLAVVVDFVKDERLTNSMVPFALLLVGFVPASFSIVAALESFVGERERDTLESLLSMPVSDRDLYISKLASSLVTPLFASTMSMLIFTSFTFTVYQRMFTGALTPTRLAILFMVVMLMATSMVAGAVMISSHINSIRAANLMSSFVLLPAAVVVQIAGFLIISNRWEVLWMVGAALGLLAGLLIRFGIGTFSREEILSREHRDILLSWFWTHWRQSHTRTLDRPGSSDARQAATDTLRRIVARPLSTIQAVRTIANRELRETLTDWRVLVPVSVLTFALPLVLLSATPLALDFVQDAPQVARVVPFAILVVGFIPASFSLITALESFVGERERGSLETLLSMPVSDKELYISKILSSVLVATLVSYTAMLLFAGGMVWLYPELYFMRMPATALLHILLIILTIVLVMVTGAVVISSHTASVRSANLMASFVLIPVTIIVTIHFTLFIGNRWDLIRITMAGLIVISIALMRTGIKTFKREEILSRENEPLRLGRIWQRFVICFREYQPAGVPFDAYRGAAFSPGRFYRHELPALLQDLRMPLMLVLSGSLVILLLGIYVGLHYTINGMDVFLRRIGHPPEPGMRLALLIFANNLRVSIFSNLLSTFTFGTLAFLVPAAAFLQIGIVSGTLVRLDGSWFAMNVDSPLQFVLAYVLPHGIIELPTFILSAALGIRLGVTLLPPPGTFTVGQHMLWGLANFAKVWLLVLFPLVLLAALVEGWLTPLVVTGLY